MQKYQKRPIIIEAIQFVDTPACIAAINELMRTDISIDYSDSENPVIKIETLEGDMIASTGDYIIKGVKGEFYPCKPDIFEQTYKNVSEDETGAIIEVKDNKDGGLDIDVTFNPEINGNGSNVTVAQNAAMYMVNNLMKKLEGEGE